MVPSTRRSFLHGATGLLAVLGGCGGVTSSTSESADTATPGVGADEEFVGSTATPDVVRLRAGTARPPVWLDDPDSDGNDRPTAADGQSYWESRLIGDSDTAAHLTVRGVDDERLSSFLSATDFDSESVYLETVRVRECFRLSLCYVAWGPEEIETDYARLDRPYTAACDAETYVYEARLIRIPATVDSEQVRGHSSSIGSGECDSDRPTAAADDESDAGGGEQTRTESTATPTETGGGY
ncbi:MAG: hypothetical protein ABEH80_06275 [Halobaculum sp.]